MDNKPVKVFIADDHPLIRMGLGMALNAKENIEVVGDADNGFDAIVKIKQVIPDVALLDIDMPGLSGTAAVRVLRRIFPEMKLLILSTYNDSNYIKDSMSAGADGYIVKAVDIDNLVKIIISFNAGEEVISPYLLNLGIDFRERSDEGDDHDFLLTKREKQILHCLTEGRGNKEISSALFLSIETVKTHIKNVFRKLDAKNRLDAVMKARHIGLID